MTKRAQQRYIAAFAIIRYNDAIVYIKCSELRAISMQSLNRDIYKSLRTINK